MDSAESMGLKDDDLLEVKSKTMLKKGQRVTPVRKGEVWINTSYTVEEIIEELKSKRAAVEAEVLAELKSKGRQAGHL